MAGAPPRRDMLRIAVALLLLGAVAFQAGRVLRTERAIIDSTGGGGISLPLDDSFIYLQYARAIAEGRPFVYTPGNEPTTGSTSLWYPLLLVPPHLVGASPSFAVAWSFGLGILFYFLTALLATRLAAKLGGWPAGLVAAVFVLASPHVLWGSLSGMEIGLYTTILLGTVSAYVRERDDGRFPTLPWWAFALAGARPEGAILCGVLALFVARDSWRALERRPGGRSPLPAALCLAAAALPFLVNVVVSGGFESTSSQAKSIFSEPYADARMSYLAGLPALWLTIAKTYLSFLLPERLPHDAMGVPLPFAWVAGIGLLSFVALGVRGRSASPATITIAALLVTAAAFAAVPVHWWVHYFRYLQGTFPLLLVAIAAGWGRLLALLPERAPRFLTASVAVAAAAVPIAVATPTLLIEQGDMIILYGHNCENILHQQVAVGRWIDENLPSDAVVGMNDAGAIAYYGHRSTVDLVGLTSAGYARVYRSGLGCLFEHLRRQPPGRIPTYFAVYPEWFPYWPASGIFGPESFRAHLGFNTICGGADMVVYPATWIDAARIDRPFTISPESRGLALVDSLDLGSLEDERRHGWRADPEATDVLRRYAFADSVARPLTDAGRIVRGRERFELAVRPGRDAELIMRTDAWFPSRLRVTVDGADAGFWEIARAESSWVEPSFEIRGRLLKRDRVEIRLQREESGGVGNYAPFRYWLYQ
ncbi:MAG TPA: hypothetical protein VFS09_04575 [Candidatus Eisenbacteria bacterium]|nr:hypothetical protein [Candidatus Eisenbacteria bacterium]